MLRILSLLLFPLFFFLFSSLASEALLHSLSTLFGVTHTRSHPYTHSHIHPHTHTSTRTYTQNTHTHMKGSCGSCGPLRSSPLRSPSNFLKKWIWLLRYYSYFYPFHTKQCTFLDIINWQGSLSLTI